MAESNFIPFLGLSDGNALDYFTAADAIYPGVAGEPVPVGRTEHPLVGMHDDSVVGIFFEGSMGQDYDGGLITADIYWVAATAEAGDVVLVLAWERLNTGQNIDATAVGALKKVTSPAPGTNGDIQKATIVFTKAEADGIAAGDPYRLVFFRDSADGDDTMSGDAQFLRLNLEGI